MKPAQFTYIAPASPEDAVQHLQNYNGEARCLSGGQSLIPLMNFRLVRPAALIDLNRCPGLDYIHRDGDTIVIGPMTRQATAEHSALVRSSCPLISKTMPYLGSPTIRNRGTIGGTIAHADRTAELPAVALALEAEMVAQGPRGLRAISADQFFLGDLVTSLQTDEILREIRFPVSSENSLCAFVETGNRHHDLALAGVAIYLERSTSGEISDARIACIGVGPHAVRLTAVEQQLSGARLDDEAIHHAAQFSSDGVKFEGDLHASAEYRKAILPGLVRRGMQQAARQAR